jgi:imidazolonepropionase
VDLLVEGAGVLATPLGTSARGGRAQGEVRVLLRGAVAVHDGVIVAVAPEDEIRQRYSAARTLDARGGLVLPGLVDAHSHPVFCGSRAAEFEARTRGASYVQIAASGGGILSSVRAVRAATQAELVRLLVSRFERFLDLGTTTLEAKSGYGLSLADERKSLLAVREAARLTPLEIVPTFLGAHEFPAEYRARRAAYVDLIVEEMLPCVAEEHLARFCDVFADAHAFDLTDARRILESARALGLGLRIHADQLTPHGGAELAAELAVLSVDHLEHVSPAGVEALARSGSVAVLCPLVALVLRQAQEAPARRLIEAGVPLAISPDFNAGTCYCQSMLEAISWAALRYRLTAAECLTGATLNAAASLGLAARLGSLEAGKVADLIVLAVPDLDHLAYELGRERVQAVVKHGIVVREPAS